MPALIELPERLYAHDFAELARGELDGRVRVRWLALAHLQEGRSPREVGMMLKVHEKTVLKWLRRFRAGGVEGMAEQPGGGAKRRLKAEQEPQLKALLAQAQAKRSGGRLRGEEIRALLAEHFGVEYSLSGVDVVLHRAGLSWISARSKHPQRNPQAQERFKKTSLSR
ncbi:IS630 family transposase [Nitrosococcus wardiae]|uniref:IS630 family transposase n=1 Tax=Nitrosococcus wardiae TaxID=1814290 RepID=A0A4P7BU03_9GAMM|nr:IS630 family transposase [Nitrosococcus wardiae]QBQ53368.1 IS630 family transposase [Nitrosococcus wardiae]